MDHQRIVLMAVRKNITLVFVSLIAISSAILLIKNLSKGWVTSVITWFMFAIILIINSYRLNQSNPGELDLISIFNLGIITVIFIAIILALINIEFRQKYNPTLKNGLL